MATTLPISPVPDPLLTKQFRPPLPHPPLTASTADAYAHGEPGQGLHREPRHGKRAAETSTTGIERIPQPLYGEGRARDFARRETTSRAARCLGYSLPPAHTQTDTHLLSTVTLNSYSISKTGLEACPVLLLDGISGRTAGEKREMRGCGGRTDARAAGAGMASGGARPIVLCGRGRCGAGQ
jgi:hypothetical protein